MDDAEAAPVALSSGATTRSVVLARLCNGLPVPEDFRIAEAPLPCPRDGEFLVRNILVSVDPGTRARLSGTASYVPPLRPGDLVGAFSVGEVVESRHPDYQAGEIVALAVGWAEHVMCNGHGFIRRITDRRLPLPAWLGVLGVSGMTAWFGLNRVGRLRDGETVVVTSAAGAVGSAAGQLARARGCKVIGIAGGPEKCRWLTDVAGFDRAIDYKAHAMAQRGETGSPLADALTEALTAVGSKGVDVLFDNVGNRMIDTVIPLMRTGARIVSSGQMDAYNRTGDDPDTGLHNTRAFITHRLRMEGFVVFDDLPAWGEAEQAMAEMVLDGRLIWPCEVRDGLQAVPEAFAGLFRGDNHGRRLVRLAPDPADFPEMPK